jgi:signal peptidase II
MKTKHLLRTFAIALLLVSNISCDQVSKTIVRQRIGNNEQIRFINDLVTLTKVENTGAFLSIGNSLPPLAKVLLLTVLPAITLALACMLMFSKSNLSSTTRIAVCFIVGGGIGNIYDRIMYGSVTDFLHIDLVLFETGIFNMADVSIMTGLCIVVVELFFNRTDKSLSHSD